MKGHLQQYGTVMESWFPLGGRGNTGYFDEAAWHAMVDFVTVGRNKEMAMTFRDGTKITA